MHWRVTESDKDLVCRLAEGEQTDVALAARETISGLRLAAAARGLSRQTVTSSLKAFPAAYSPQNLVLVVEVPPDPEHAILDEGPEVGGPEGYAELRRFPKTEYHMVYGEQCT